MRVIHANRLARTVTARTSATTLPPIDDDRDESATAAVGMLARS
jgi:hypothetical protein